MDSLLEHSTLIFLIPVISAFIGWLTNFFAIKMLFHPRKKVKLLLFTLQGIIPANQKRIADRLSKTITSSLFSEEDLKKEILSNKEVDNVILNEIDGYVDSFLRNKISEIIPMASMFINDNLINKAKEILLRDLKEKIPNIKESLINNSLEKLNLRQHLQDKINAFSLVELEDVLMGILKKEFRFVEITGAIVGFLIGFIQVAILY